MPSHSHSITSPLWLRSCRLNSAEPGAVSFSVRLEWLVTSMRYRRSTCAPRPSEAPVRMGVVAERQPGRRFGGARRGDLQVEALHAAEGVARGDLEAVAPALAGAGGEQPVAAAADRAAARSRAVLLPSEGARAGREQRAADAGAFGLVGEVDQVADARAHREGVGRVDVLDAIDLTVDPAGRAAARPAARSRVSAGRLRARSSRAERSRERGDANQVEAVLRGLERERGLAVRFGLLTADRLELRAHRVVDVDRGVELAAGRQVERDPLRRWSAQAVPDGVRPSARRTRIRVRPLRS